MCRPTKRPKQFAVVAEIADPVDFESQALTADLKETDAFFALSSFLGNQDDLLLPGIDFPDATDFVEPKYATIEEHRPKTFVFTTYEMVCEPSNMNAIRFNAEGTALEIWNPELLSECVLPRYFRHKNVASFYRQLNSYGFRTARNASASISHTFVHEKFQRGMPELLHTITRKRCTPREKKDKPSSQASDLVSASSASPSNSSAPSTPEESTKVAEPIVFLAKPAAPVLEAVVPKQVAVAKEESTNEKQMIQELRASQLRALEYERNLQAQNRRLAEENKAMLMESERVFSVMNQLVDGQTGIIEKLFGIEAAQAFGEQAKPFRFDFSSMPSLSSESTLKPLESPKVQSRAQEFNDFLQESNEFLNQDVDLETLEHVFSMEVDDMSLIA